MNFIEDDQTILVLPEKESWLCKPVPVLPCLQVKVERCGTAARNLSCQCRFANLTGADDCHCGLFGQGVLD